MNKIIQKYSLPYEMVHILKVLKCLQKYLLMDLEEVKLNLLLSENGLEDFEFESTTKKI